MNHPLIDLQGEPTPELLPLAQIAIEGILQDGGRVLEFGSGHSTVWLAALTANVVSVDNDAVWHHAVEEWLGDYGFCVDLRLCPLELMHTVATEYPDDTFDLVFVDCLDRYRIACLEASKAKVAPGGWLVLDDAQWLMLAAAPHILHDWQRMDIIGVHTRKTGKRKPVLTSFYRKPPCSS